MKRQTIDKFVRDQLSQWPEAAANFRSLKKAATREMDLRGLRVRLQHNPERIRSSAAKLDEASIRARRCFLCAENRPPQQRALLFEGRKGRGYHILVNPYPIFPSHLVIARDAHVDQSIWKQYVDMTDLARLYPEFTVFYNGPRCGASAPDHMHFQAAPRGLMPLEVAADGLLDLIVPAERGVPNGEETITIPEALRDDIEYITSVQEAQLYHYKHFTKGVFFLRARTSKSLAKLFYRLLDCAEVPEGSDEPMFNLLTWYKRADNLPARSNTHGQTASEYRAIVIFRRSHRSHHYFSDGPDHLTMSPGCADMAGLLIVPSAEDYAKLDERLVCEMLDEVSVSPEAEADILWKLRRTQPKVQVGILSASEITFEIISDGAGPQKVAYQEGKILYNGALYDELVFEAQTLSTLFAEPTFILYDVTIGVGFHWERKVTQKFAGTLKFIVDGGKVVAVNMIGVEDYLLSVISSEMKSSAPLEFLKAHAVISRSWLMAQIEHRSRSHAPAVDMSELNSVPALVTQLDTSLATGEEQGGDIVRWFDHQDHKRFDVCADDHCQRYQGLSMAVGPVVRKAIDATWGEVLTSEGELCDARFSKCCGGKSELFSSCWEDKDLPYLQALPDTPGHGDGPCFCDTADESVLSGILNDYDLETRDFFNWQVRYTQEQLSDIFARRSGHDLGLIESLEPCKIGPSGRIVLLKVVGSKGSLVIGKELIIRKFLSESHLKSSCFTVRREGTDFILDGRGWGHGVGLCQIGAAVMASKGYSYRDILSHYYPGTQLSRP